MVAATTHGMSIWGITYLILPVATIQAGARLSLRTGLPLLQGGGRGRPDSIPAPPRARLGPPGGQVGRRPVGLGVWEGRVPVLLYAGRDAQRATLLYTL